MLNQGYECYIIDQTFCGRSPWTPAGGTLDVFSAEHIQRYFTATEVYNSWPQAQLHTQWPGNGVIGDPIFDAYYTSTVPFVNISTTQQLTVQQTGAQLLGRIGKPVTLIAHSQGGMMAWLIADSRPDFVQSLVAIEPAGPPFRDQAFGNEPARAWGLADVRITYSPPVTHPEDFVRQTIPSPSEDEFDCIVQADSPPPRKLPNLSKFPVLLVTTESSYHAQYDWCTVHFLRQAGVQTDHLELGKAGIHGNGHMVFLEKNSDDVARMIAEWQLSRSITDEF